MEEPLTILSLLQRAADKHPDNTIAFAACSRDREAHHITYAKLAEIAHVWNADPGLILMAFLKVLF